jgi:hypothetical protein
MEPLTVLISIPTTITVSSVVGDPIHMLAKPGMAGTTSEAAQTAVSDGMTVGEIAEALKKIEPNSAALIERIRAWTKQKILLPISNVAAGTGKHLRYDDMAPFEVAMLHALANTGLHVAGKPFIQFALARLRHELPTWQRQRQKTKRRPPLFLVVKYQSQVTALDPTADVVARAAIDETSESMCVVNLALLFGQAQSRASRSRGRSDDPRTGFAAELRRAIGET